MDVSTSITTRLIGNETDVDNWQDSQIRFRITPGTYSVTEEDGTAILNVESGIFYSIVGPGSKIWDKLVASPQGVTLNDLVSSVQVGFEDASSQELKHEIENFLSKLNQKGIVCTNDNNSERFIEATRGAVNSLIIFLARLTVHCFLMFKLHKAAAFFCLTLVDAMLVVSGFRELHRTVQLWPIADKGRVCLEAINDICAAVDRACVYYPKRALCLQRSVVATCLLRQLGISAQMVIGCRKLPFSSHAWVEVENIVVNDHKNVQTYFKILERI
jgi:hypothetical protein